jgi:hypothetical protein
MSKSVLQDIQQALNAILSEIERVDDELKWAALELMLSTSSSVVALSKKMTKPEIKTVTRTVAVPKTKIVKQQTPQQPTPKETKRHRTKRLYAYSSTTTVTKSTKSVSYYSLNRQNYTVYSCLRLWLTR